MTSEIIPDGGRKDFSIAYRYSPIPSDLCEDCGLPEFIVIHGARSEDEAEDIVDAAVSQTDWVLTTPGSSIFPQYVWDEEMGQICIELPYGCKSVCIDK